MIGKNKNPNGSNFKVKITTSLIEASKIKGYRHWIKNSEFCI